MSVRTRLQRRAASSVIVEAVPFLKRVLWPAGRSFSLSQFSIAWAYERPTFSAEGFGDAVGVVEEVVGVNDGDADLAILHWESGPSCSPASAGPMSLFDRR